MGPESKHNALCRPLGPPPVVLGCHAGGGPSGTSGWNLGPFYSERRRRIRAGLNKEEQSVMLSALQLQLVQKLNVS